MVIPQEFVDYMTSTSHLSEEEQLARFTKMHLKEIKERATILRNLRFDKDAVKKRLRSYVVSGFDFFDTPSFMHDIDTIVDCVYESKIPVGW